MSAQPVSALRPDGARGEGDGVVRDQALFREVFRRHPAGVAVVTLLDPVFGRPVGFTATSVISVSADPPTLAFSISRGSSSWPALSQADGIVVNFLPSGHTALSQRFATHGIDRFEGVAWRPLDSGEPVLAGTTWVHARVADRHPTADSALVVARVVQGAVGETPLVFFDRGYHGLFALPPLSEGI